MIKDNLKLYLLTKKYINPSNNKVVDKANKMLRNIRKKAGVPAY